MDTSEFTRRLREIAEELKPLTSNGGSNRYALAWYSKLLELASMTEAQGGALSEKQHSYLRQELFGGMGSLNDLWFDNAPTVNERLDGLRQELFASFKKIAPGS